MNMSLRLPVKSSCLCFLEDCILQERDQDVPETSKLYEKEADSLVH